MTYVPLARRLTVGPSAVMLLATMAGSACAPRVWTRAAEPDSVLSPSAPPAPLASPGRALIEEPPLPGGPTDGWLGLGPRPEGSSPLSLEDAVALAISHNREAHAARLEVGIAEGAVRQAGQLANPELQVEVLQSANHGPKLEVDLTHAVLAPLRVAAAEPTLEAANTRATLRVQQLALEARTAWFAVAAAQERLALANQALDGLAAAKDAATALGSAGNVTALDRASQVAAFESARVEVAELELELERHQERLRRALGLHGSATVIRIAPWKPSVPEKLEEIRELESQALSANLELREAQSSLQALGRQSQLSHWSGVLPEVVAGVKTEREDENWLIGGVLKVSLPLLDRKQGQRDAALAAFDAARARLDALAVNIRSEARELHQQWTTAHRRVRHFDAVLLPSRRAQLQEALLQYNAMQLSLFQLLSVRQAVLSDELAAVKARQDFFTAQAALDAFRTGVRVSALSISGAGKNFNMSNDSGDH